MSYFFIASAEEQVEANDLVKKLTGRMLRVHHKKKLSIDRSIDEKA
jgi:hypothetical protein